jgi:hypothetical protein
MDFFDYGHVGCYGQYIDLSDVMNNNLAVIPTL